ncbi:methionine--tRNA ligase [Kordia sp.]|uniref:methionine--tRNA ligase n=1 Tax=Kordia sp. TaxID=1965332 RepID=UPI0025C13F91|nr:methionine--tRNA ligase [Kordia sp.]MCH2080922.1 methionine--tRNA ligase [Saprospiraceae bacterium]MCH2193284.1 methionine--tRNA ligase [Kordia sp.]
MSEKKYLITSALPYANGPLHLGHLSGAYLPADIYVRYLRLLGKDVVWVCGSDEHGAAITIRAKKEGISPKEIIDKYHELNKSSFERLGISFDHYHRTSAQLHHETAQEFFTKLYEKGDEFEEQSIDQYYDEGFDQFLADRYIVGTCPRCGHDEAYGDQCENCGSDLSPTELINPRSTLSGKSPVLRTTKHWYFKLNKHEDWLRQWIDEGQLDGVQHHDAKEWKKHVVGQCLSWLDNGLQPRAITRDLSWGIPVPVEGGAGKVLYVWFDAPIGYISSTKQWALDNGKDWEAYWKGDDVELIHFIGKDNIVFHCIVFPAMLKAYGDFALPKNVPANQFLNFEGQKFSKSRGWGIEQHKYLEEFADFPNKEDALRYTLIRNLPENKDSDFRWDDFEDHHDKELVGNLGNFLNRVVVLTNKYYEGVIPSPTNIPTDKLAEAYQIAQRISSEVETFGFKAAILSLMELSSWGNTYLQDVSPWKIWKTDPESEKIKECMFVCAQVVGLLSILSEPFLPFTAPKIRRILNLGSTENGDLAVVLAKAKANEAIIEAGHQMNKPELLFAQINDRKDHSRKEIVDRQRAKLEAILAQEKANEREPIKDTIQFDDFTKLDLRTGTITAAEKIPKAKKLLKLTVDLGIEERTVVSGIAAFFKAEEVVGTQVVLVANLAPRKLRGVESQGMILMAENEKGELGFVSPQEGMGNGFVVK